MRQLQSLGFNIKREILTEVETANKFYRCATPPRMLRIMPPLLVHRPT